MSSHPHPVVVGVIPARYASQRLPAKPLIDLEGKPMVQRVHERASASGVLSRLVVATDDERIAAVVRAFGGEAVMTSTDLRSGTDRVAAVAAEMPGDLFVNIQGDEPLLAPEAIGEAVEVLLADPDAAIGTLAKPIENEDELVNPAVVKVVTDRRGRALYFSRSVIPHVREAADRGSWISGHRYLKHLGLYVYRRAFLRQYASLPEAPLETAERLEQLRALYHGFIIAVGTTSHDSLPVDTLEDAERIRGILRNAERKP